MSRVGASNFKAAAAAVFGSLEKRLIGALLLIVICTGALQVISQDRAFRLRAESAVLRAQAAVRDGNPASQSHEDAARVFVSEAALRVDGTARNALAAMSEGDTLRTLLAALRRVLKTTPANTVALRRALADATVAKGRYIF